MATVKKQQIKEERKETKRIYCGPNLSGFTQFTVLGEETPKYVELYIKDCPQIEKLIVPIEKLNHTRLKLSVKGSYEQKMYLEIMKYVGGVN